MDRRDFLKLGVLGGAAGSGTLLLVDVATDEGSRDRERPGTPTPTSEPDVSPGTPPTETATPGTSERPPTDEPDQPTTEPLTTPEPVRHQDQYGTVVDAVEAGADPEGGAPINGMLRSNAADDTLISLPGGTYRLRPLTLTDLSNFGIAAAGEERPTFVPERDSYSGSGRFLSFEGVSDFRLDGCDFDFCHGGTGGKLTVIADGDAVVSNVSVATSCSEHLQVLGISVRNPDAAGLVENFQATNEGDNVGLTGIYVGKPHAGELTVRDCALDGFSDNGLYGSAPGLPGGDGGIVPVEGGTYANNNISNIRLGSESSTAKDVTVRVDGKPSVDAVNVRGIRLRNGHGQVVENCEITYGDDAGDSFGAVVFHPENGGAEIRDTTITMDRDDVPAIFAPYNATDYDDSPVFENVTVEGGAARGYTANFVGREDVTFRNCTITQTGTDRHGIRIANNPGGRIEDCRIEVPGLPLHIDDATAEIRNTTIVNHEGERTIDTLTARNQTVWP
jgi:hypothetical protein